MLLKVEVQVTNKNRNCCQRIVEHMYHHTILQISPSIISNIGAHPIKNIIRRRIYLMIDVVN